PRAAPPAPALAPWVIPPVPARPAARGPRLGVRGRPILGRLAPQDAVLRRVRPGNALALSHIPENRKVWARNSLIFPDTLFGFCLEKAIVRQSRSVSPDFLHSAIRRHSMHVQWRGLLLGMSLLSGCSSVPTGPSVVRLVTGRTA